MLHHKVKSSESLLAHRACAAACLTSPIRCKTGCIVDTVLALTLECKGAEPQPQPSCFWTQGPHETSTFELLAAESLQQVIHAGAHLSPGPPGHTVANSLCLVSSGLLLCFLLLSLAFVIVAALKAKPQTPERVLETKQQPRLAIAVRRLTPAGVLSIRCSSRTATMCKIRVAECMFAGQF